MNRTAKRVASRTLQLNIALGKSLGFIQLPLQNTNRHTLIPFNALFDREHVVRKRSKKDFVVVVTLDAELLSKFPQNWIMLKLEKKYAVWIVYS